MLLNLVKNMGSARFLKPSPEYEGKIKFELIEELIDPVRSKILFETLLRGKTTADMLEKSTGKSKSTISHHLKKLVLGRFLKVSISPTGKTKYYQLSDEVQNRGFAFKFDADAFKEASLEEQTEFILNLFKASSAFSHVFANLFSEQHSFLSKNQPFEKVELNAKEKVEFYIKSKKSKMPTQLNTVVSEEAIELVNIRIDELIDEIREKFGSVIDVLKDPSIDPKYILTFQIFPYFREE